MADMARDEAEDLQPPGLQAAMGTNLAGIADWATQYPFRDFFKNDRKWTPVRDGVWGDSESADIDVDGDGWVKSFSSRQPFDEVATLLPNAPKFDRYVVTYEGEGSLLFPNDKVVTDEAASSPGRMVINAPGSDAIDLRIAKTDPNQSGDYIHNIQVVPEPFATLPETHLFNPDFLDSLKGFEALRFMDWMNTNFSTQGAWGERAKTTDSTFANAEGVPIELMVALANQTGTDPWFSMPHQATDEYVRNFAQYVRDNLDSELKVYVEYSNEIWNEEFEQHNYAQQQGQQMSGLGDTPPWLAYHAQRSSEIGQIWDSEFGAQQDRSIGVLGSYFADPDISQGAIDFITRDGQSLSEAGIDRLAVAPYFGGAVGSAANVETLNQWTLEPDGGVDKVFQELNEGGLLAHTSIGGVMHRFEEELKENVALSKEEGIELVAYEGGQHVTPYGARDNQAIVDLFVQVNADKRMGGLYQSYFDIWEKQGGGLFVNFTDVSVPSKWGSWGTKENLYQPSSPKWVAVQATMSDWNQQAASGQPTELKSLSADGVAVEDRTSQSVMFGEIVDLRQVDLNQDGEVDSNVQLRFSNVDSAAGYFNTVGFYEVETADGGVIDNASGVIVLPGDANYAEVAIENRIDAIELDRDTLTLSTEVEGGMLLAPFLVANGTVDSLLSQTSINEWGEPTAYFAYEAANADGIAHVRAQGNQLQFEDFFGGGDRNFTDFVVSVDIVALG